MCTKGGEEAHANYAICDSCTFGASWATIGESLEPISKYFYHMSNDNPTQVLPLRCPNTL